MCGSWGTELGEPDPSLKDTTGTPPMYSFSSSAGEADDDRTKKTKSKYFEKTLHFNYYGITPVENMEKILFFVEK